MAIKNEEEEKVKHNWIPTKEEEEAKLIFDDANIIANERRQTVYSEFGSTLTGYIDKSDSIYNALQKRIEFKGKELSDLQSNIPRNKISAINAKVALNIPKPIINAWGEDSIINESGTKVLSGLNDWTEENKGARILNIKKGNTMFAHGTVCTFTDFENIIRKVRDIITPGLDPETKERTIIDRYGVYTRIVPLQEIYLASFYISDIQQQPFIIWKRTFNEENFKSEFNKDTFYKNTETVMPGMKFAQIENVSYSIESQEIDPGKILVERLYIKSKDRIITKANGVIIQDIPFPWYHKKYPFAWSINDFFSNVDFAYGMSIPHKLSWDVESIEFLTNAAFEQAKVGVNPVMVNYGLTEFEDDVLYSGRVIKSEGQKGDLDILQFPGIDQSVFQLMGVFQGNADRASVDDLTGGNSSGGKGVTARRDVMAQQNAKDVLSVPFTMMLDLQKQETELQLPNIIQFYTEPVSAAIIGKNGKDSVRATYKQFRILNTEITKIKPNGKLEGKAKGILEINIDENEMPTKDIDMREDRARAAGIQLEVLSPSPTALRNLKFTTRIPYPDDFTTSNDQKYARLSNTVGMVAQFYPEGLNKPEVAKELFKLSTDNPEKMLLDEEDMQQQASARDAQGSNTSTGVERQLRQPENTGLNEFGG